MCELQPQFLPVGCSAFDDFGICKGCGCHLSAHDHQDFYETVSTIVERVQDPDIENTLHIYLDELIKEYTALRTAQKEIK